MSFWKKLFGGGSKPMPGHGLSERDNVGTYFETEEHVYSYWSTYGLDRSLPFVFYYFQKKKDAMDAMLSLPPIKIASDSGKLISTEVLQFGIYSHVEDSYDPKSKTVWGFFLAGQQMTLALFDTAVASCEKYNGEAHHVSDPPKDPATVTSSSSKPDSASVTFDWEEKLDLLEQAKVRGIPMIGIDATSPQIATKRHYKAPNKEAALAFLRANPVDRPLYSLVVHTPDGVFGRDKDGVFEPTG